MLSLTASSSADVLASHHCVSPSGAHLAPLALLTEPSASPSRGCTKPASTTDAKAADALGSGHLVPVQQYARFKLVSSRRLVHISVILYLLWLTQVTSYKFYASEAFSSVRKLEKDEDRSERA
jgi:hypothetical protein